MTDVLGWGVIGLGRFGPIHAEVVRSLRGVELVALATRRVDRLNECADRFGVARRYTDYRALVDDPSVDVVSITTHWRDHASVALAALAAGKHVLLEKPMAPTANECRRLIEVAQAARRRLMVGHVCRFDPRVALAHEAIEAGRLGRIVSMHARRNLARAPASVRLDKIPPLMGDGIHDADLMLWFTGRMPTGVYARTIRVGQAQHADIGWAMLEFGDEAMGVVETIWCLPENTPYQIDARMEVIGTEGALYIDCANAGLAIQDARGWHQPDTAYWPLVHERRTGALASELAYFADCVRRGIDPAVITPEEAACAVAVMEAAERSAAQGQRIAIGA